MRSKTLYAISGMIKENKFCYKSFVEADGYTQLFQVLELNDLGSKRRVIFLLGHLLLSHPDADTFVGTCIEKLADQLQSDDLELQEKAAQTLLNYLQVNTVETVARFKGVDGLVERVKQFAMKLPRDEDHQDLFRSVMDILKRTAI